MNKLNFYFPLFLFSVMQLPAHAEIDRVYHPYVEQNETELEYGFTLRDLRGERELFDRLGVGYTWNDKLFTEIYLLAEDLSYDDKQLSGYELEARLQLTEQGEYWADWGLLFEIASAKDISSHEWSVGILWEKEFNQHWVATANMMVEYEYGSDIQDEFETALRGQWRYRYNSSIEPALEFYFDDQDRAAGPALAGTIKLSGSRQLVWELGLMFALDSKTPASNLRGGIEFEF